MAADLTRPSPARQDAPLHGQGRSSPANPRFTFHVFMVLGSEASGLSEQSVSGERRSLHARDRVKTLVSTEFELYLLQGDLCRGAL